MAEYIEREALISIIRERNSRVPSWIEECISDCSTIDVRPERHGGWDIDFYCNRVCSCCSYTDSNAVKVSASNYCPNCGAKMDGEDGDDK